MIPLLDQQVEQQAAPSSFRFLKLLTKTFFTASNSDLTKPDMEELFVI